MRCFRKIGIFVPMTTSEEKYTRRRYHSSVATTVVSITLVLVMLGLLALTVFHAKKL